MINYVIVHNKDKDENIKKWLEDYGHFLAQTSWENSFCVYEVNYNESIEELPKGIYELPSSLVDILYSSKKSYQPAIALAREKMISFYSELKDSSANLFIIFYYKTVKYYLDNQKNYPFFIAQSKTEDYGWLMPDYYYWIVGYNEKENKVYWVSDDYFIYEDSVTDAFKDIPKSEGYFRYKFRDY